MWAPGTRTGKGTSPGTNGERQFNKGINIHQQTNNCLCVTNNVTGWYGQRNVTVGQPNVATFTTQPSVTTPGQPVIQPTGCGERTESTTRNNVTRVGTSTGPVTVNNVTNQPQCPTVATSNVGTTNRVNIQRQLQQMLINHRNRNRRNNV